MPCLLDVWYHLAIYISKFKDAMFVITGGGSGVGRSLALALAKRKHPVLIAGRREHHLKETASHSSLIQYVVADIATASGLDRVCDQVQKLSRISALINNASTLEPIAPMHDIKPEDWRHAMQTNIDAALFLPQKLGHQLIGGRVLNMGSGAAYFPIQGWSAYCISKAALAMLTRCWQVESASVSFASVMPGIVDTEMQVIARSGKHMDPEHVTFYKRLKEDNRLVTSDTTAEFLCWLLLEVDKEMFVSKEWDIYDTDHHKFWLKNPHQVLHWDY